jgi:hypothetical protein
MILLVNNSSRAQIAYKALFWLWQQANVVLEIWVIEISLPCTKQNQNVQNTAQ